MPRRKGRGNSFDGARSPRSMTWLPRSGISSPTTIVPWPSPSRGPIRARLWRPKMPSYLCQAVLADITRVFLASQRGRMQPGQLGSIDSSLLLLALSRCLLLILEPDDPGTTRTAVVTPRPPLPPTPEALIVVMAMTVASALHSRVRGNWRSRRSPIAIIDRVYLVMSLTAISAFRQLASDYCRLVDTQLQEQRLSQAEFLQRVRVSLADLYAGALHLPEVEPVTGDVIPHLTHGQEQATTTAPITTVAKSQSTP